MKSPSPSQMRALQLLREGKLIWKAASPGLFNISLRLEPGVRKQEPSRVSESIHPATAKILVERGWVEMRGFSPRAGTYRLSATGKELSEAICECKYRGRLGRGTQNKPAHDFALISGIDPVSTAKVDWPKERLLCVKCWRLARCEAKFFKQAHGANRYVWGVGPVCQFHVDNPTKR